MSFRVLVRSGLATEPPAWQAADLVLDWEGPQANLSRNLFSLQQHLPADPSPLARDLVDIATAVHGADLGLLRGRNEQWVRSVQMLVPVREPDFWSAQAANLSYLLYVLTRDSFGFHFVPRAAADDPPPVPRQGFAADCICLFSGGIDSLAGAVMLARTGRRPLLVAHQSGNPSILAAQTHAARLVEGVAPGRSALGTVRLQPSGRRGTFPPAAQREPSQRSRTFLFTSLAMAAADALGATEAFIAENGILTVALPLTEARVGGLSTRSTHPRVIGLINDLARACGMPGRLINPFVCHTKGEIVRDILRPLLAPADIQRTVSCWATGRASRQCGGCVACLVRRLAMATAGLPDEAYEVDILGSPESYRGTDAHANLMDLLTLCSSLRSRSDAELLSSTPELLDCVSCGVPMADVLGMYRRFSEEVCGVVKERFPAAAQLMG